jgi:hypothetical protein
MTPLMKMPFAFFEPGEPVSLLRKKPKNLLLIFDYPHLKRLNAG